MKSMKKTLVMAMATTALGATLLAGGTFAVFTSSASNTGNTFSAGTVVVNLDKEGETEIFENINNIAPGDSGSGTVEVQNNGTLDLYYDIDAWLTGALAEGPYGLKVRLEKNGVEVQSHLNDHYLNSGSRDTWTVTWELPIDADNQYQGTSADLKVIVNAEQARNNEPAQP